MRLLGIDYGDAVVGVAITDEEGKIAFAHSVLPRNGEFLSSLERVIKDNNVGAIVVGEPLTQAGSENPLHAAVRVFKEKLEKRFDLPVYWQDERFSTFEAGRLDSREEKKHSHGRADAHAAAIILQRYIDTHHQS